jgi:hypothetical protein
VVSLLRVPRNSGQILTHKSVGCACKADRQVLFNESLLSNKAGKIASMPNVSLTGRPALYRWAEAVPHPTHGMDQLDGVLLINLLP